MCLIVSKYVCCQTCVDGPKHAQFGYRLEKLSGIYGTTLNAVQFDKVEVDSSSVMSSASFVLSPMALANAILLLTAGVTSAVHYVNPCGAGGCTTGESNMTTDHWRDPIRPPKRNDASNPNGCSQDRPSTPRERNSSLARLRQQIVTASNMTAYLALDAKPSCGR